LDDTDDNDSFTGSNKYTDEDDRMVVLSMTSGRGMYVDFLNEGWNLGNTPQIINIFWDKGSSKNIDNTVMRVVFFDENGNPLTDTNGDGYIDLGLVSPGERVKFITRVYVLERSFKDVVIAIKGFAEDIEKADFTFNIIKDIQPATAVVNVTVSVGASIAQEKLEKHKVVIYEFDENGNRTDTPPIVLWTDDNGYILYDEEGNIKPLYNVLRYGYKYRLSIYGEYKDTSYYLSPQIEKIYFDSVENTGEEKCWDKAGNEVSCDNKRYVVKIRVLEDGTKELILPLDPAGYVYDADTNEKIEKACVYFYRCTDETCREYYLVDNDLLDYYSNPELGRQTNPQLTSTKYGAGAGEGTFEFIFQNFEPDLRGWYFLEVDFECEGANAQLKEIYEPVKLKENEVWYPESGEPYTGEKFYIDENFPGAILVKIPLGKAPKKSLIVKKEVYPSVASVGDLVKWRISVKNNGNITAYSVEVKDYLPRGFRYKEKTTKLDAVRYNEPSIEGNGRVLKWNIGDLAPEEEKVVEFYTSVISSAQEGKHKNLADATGWLDLNLTTPIYSNQAFAYIKITKGLFTDKGYIFGKVFIDQNNNRIHDENEPIIQGAKIYLDNGRYAVTDVEGKYHFDNLNPRTYVVKIDKTSLPKGAKLIVLNSRNAGDPDTVFADVYPGEMHKVNFALAPFKPEIQIFETFKKIKGKLKLERGIDDILVEPLKENIKVKHYLIIENKSKEPLYEVIYKEKSQAVPEKGTVYLNGAPFKDPEIDNGYFYWQMPIIMPKEKLKLNWISSVKRGVIKPEAIISFKFKPTEKENPIPVNIPVEFGIIKDKEYELVVYFDFGKAELSPVAKKSLEKLVEHLRKINFKHLYIKIKGHTDAVRVVNPEIKDNKNLSLLRAEAVKKFLKEHLIDLKRVEIK
ncbi:MAG: OmpA family protein, partial [Aquificae bacterium]|nr:OmpA family protein [Aquificota bacterium]